MCVLSPLKFSISLSQVVDERTNFNNDDLLTNLCIYYFSKSFATSTLIYYENFGSVSDWHFCSLMKGSNKLFLKAMAKPLRVTDVPLGLSVFNDVFVLPEKWIKAQHPALCYHRKHDLGGHFGMTFSWACNVQGTDHAPSI